MIICAHCTDPERGLRVVEEGGRPVLRLELDGAATSIITTDEKLAELKRQLDLYFGSAEEEAA